MKVQWKNCAAVAASGILITVGSLAAQQTANPNGNMSNDSKMSSDSKGSMGKSGAKSADARFARDAAIGGMEEVELGKLATQKGQSDKVKQFGQRMVDDHTKAGNELKGIAAKENMTLPSDLDAKHKAMVDKYSNLSGAEFDRAYMRDMVKDHEKDIAEFQKEANSGMNSDLKNWAGSTLPTLQEHLRMAKEANSSLTSTTSQK